MTIEKGIIKEGIVEEGIVEEIKLTLKLLYLKDPREVRGIIERFIAEQINRSGRNGVILGISGGVDSAVVASLCVNALGPERVYSVCMPEKDNKPKNMRDAERIAKLLGIHFKIVNLIPLLETLGIYELYPMKWLTRFPTRKLQGFISQNSRSLIEKITGIDPIIESRRGSNKKFVAGGNAYVSVKHRLRMVILNLDADLKNLFSVGAANKTEWLTGVFVKFGIDGIADLMPILPLFKTQVRQLAGCLGLPRDIVNKPSDPDIAPGFENKGRLFGKEDILDLTLLGIEKKIPSERISEELGVPLKFVKKTRNLVQASRHMREVPYTPGYLLGV